MKEDTILYFAIYKKHRCKTTYGEVCKTRKQAEDYVKEVKLTNQKVTKGWVEEATLGDIRHKTMSNEVGELCYTKGIYMMLEQSIPEDREEIN